MVSENQKKHNLQYRKNHPDKIIIHNSKYYLKHKEIIKQKRLNKYNLQKEIQRLMNINIE